MCEKHDFEANFRRQILTILSINSTFVKLKIRMSDKIINSSKNTKKKNQKTL